jgi:H+/Cl- antiporter ClcA
MLTFLLELFAVCCFAYAAFVVVGVIMGLAGIAASNTSAALRRLLRRIAARHQGSP